MKEREQYFYQSAHYQVLGVMKVVIIKRYNWKKEINLHCKLKLIVHFETLFFTNRSLIVG